MTFRDVGTQSPSPIWRRKRPAGRIVVVKVISNLEFGGAQRQVVELAHGLDPERFEVHVCSLSRYVPLASGLAATERFHVIKKYFKFDATVVLRLARLLWVLDADIVHTYLFDADIAGRLAARLIRTPVVVASERNTDYHLKRRQLLLYRLTRPAVDLVIANSQAGAAFHRRLTGHATSQYRVIPNGVDTERFRPRDTDLVRRSLGLVSDLPVIGVFASFKDQKNHPLFLAAVRQLLGLFPKMQLLFVGDQLHRGLHGSASYHSKIQRMVDELSLRPHCRFLGNRADVEKIYPACTFTVLPSRFEGTPNAALESMACGVPVVITDVSDNATVVPDGRAGFVVPPDDPNAMADRMAKLLADSRLAASMGQFGRSWVSREYSIGRLVGRTTVAYVDALAFGPHRGPSRPPGPPDAPPRMQSENRREGFN